jgi:hypothetical protein
MDGAHISTMGVTDSVCVRTRGREAKRGAGGREEERGGRNGWCDGVQLHRGRFRGLMGYGRDMASIGRTDG